MEGEQEKDKLAKESPPTAITDTSKNKVSEVHSQPSTTFCICPAPPLGVGTFGFWSLRGAWTRLLPVDVRGDQGRVGQVRFFTEKSGSVDGQGKSRRPDQIRTLHP